MQKLIICLCLISVVSSARMAFKLAAGIENFITNIDKSFTCDGKNYGYYADVQNECKLFHVCLPMENEVGKENTMEQFTFACGNQTVFNQETLTCTNVEDSIDCADSTNLFESINAHFGEGFKARAGQFIQGFNTDNPNQPQPQDTTPFPFQG